MAGSEKQTKTTISPLLIRSSASSTYRSSDEDFDATKALNSAIVRYYNQILSANLHVRPEKRREYLRLLRYLMLRIKKSNSFWLYDPTLPWYSISEIRSSGAISLPANEDPLQLAKRFIFTDLTSQISPISNSPAPAEGYIRRLIDATLYLLKVNSQPPLNPPDDDQTEQLKCLWSLIMQNCEQRFVNVVVFVRHLPIFSELATVDRVRLTSQAIVPLTVVTLALDSHPIVLCFTSETCSKIIEKFPALADLFNAFKRSVKDLSELLKSFKPNLVDFAFTCLLLFLDDSPQPNQTQAQASFNPKPMLEQLRLRAQSHYTTFCDGSNAQIENQEKLLTALRWIKFDLRLAFGLTFAQNPDLVALSCDIIREVYRDN